MLAIYDSESNQLRAQKDLDQTSLYENLIRRFVVREAEKDSSFSDYDRDQRNDLIATNMQRLGVAALGMFNRRSLHIRLGDLDRDLQFFQLGRTPDNGPGSPLSAADLLVGSFFFVQESKSSAQSEGPGQPDTAFEFLHNTFGEFLTARFALEQIVEQVDTLVRSSYDPKLRTMAEEKWQVTGGAPAEWYATFTYEALFARPIILNMMGEWIQSRLESFGVDSKAFLNELDWIILMRSDEFFKVSRCPRVLLTLNTPL